MPLISIQDISDFIQAKLSGPQAKVQSIHHVGIDCCVNSIFVAIQGSRSDGHSFITQAIENGAVAIISERSQPENFPIAWLQVKNVRLALAQASAIIYAHPSASLNLVGITGTNGKTTTAYILDSIFRCAFGNSAMIGTVEYRYADIVEPASRTTPEASYLNSFFRRAVDAGCCYGVMEVSSQAIDLYRVFSLNFKVAAFTNLTQDHLDYHKTMENYFAAKRKLFDGSLGFHPSSIVLNRDDDYGERLFQEVIGSSLKLSYGIDSNQKSIDVIAEKFYVLPNGMEVLVRTPDCKLELKSRLVGRPHVYNILTAVSIALALNISTEYIVKGIELVQVPGRFERVDDGSFGFTVVVDYAHTPDALIKVLGTARELVANSGRVITVFGCGGDRDQDKRPLMGEAAIGGSDLVFATSDNPRSESPEKILSEIEVGLSSGKKKSSCTATYQTIKSREEAISEAIKAAKFGDIVVVAGKGHENYQILGEETVPFDDREVVRKVLSTLQKNTKEV